MLHSVASDLGLHCLFRLVSSNLRVPYSIYLPQGVLRSFKITGKTSSKISAY